MSESDFKPRPPAPATARPLLPLSNKASTDSWSILFSLLMIISGAPSSSNFFNLLFLFINLLYKSFKSEVANLPPSSCTIGLNSGGITGITSNIIASGGFFPSEKGLITFILWIALCLLWADLESKSDLSFSISDFKSTNPTSSLTASAPIPPVKYSSYLSIISRHNVSFSIKVLGFKVFNVWKASSITFISASDLSFFCFISFSISLFLSLISASGTLPSSIALSSTFICLILFFSQSSKSSSTISFSATTASSSSFKSFVLFLSSIETTKYAAK